MEQEKKIFRYNEAAGITSLDPSLSKNLANIWVCNQLFNGLVQLDEQLYVQPCISKSWSISRDGLTYTFKLRTDVYFHKHERFGDTETRSVTAHDFVYSFNRIIDPSNASPGAWVFQNIGFQDGTPLINAINDSLLSIQLSKPFPPFLGILAMKYCSVVPREIVDFYGKEFRQHPVGTGPFYFQYWKEGVKLVLRKNDYYFETDHQGNSLPYIDAVSITFLMDKQSAFLEFVKGNLDFLSGLDPGYKDEILTRDGALSPKYIDQFYLITEPYLNTEYLGIMMDSETIDETHPLQLREVRQAINHGFDRHKMIRYLRNNIGTPGTNGIIPAGMPSFDSLKIKGYNYDPDKSQKLLADAGFPNGEGLAAITLTTSSEYLDLCKFIQHEMSDLGIQINIDVSPPATLKELKAQAKLAFFRASWIADYPEAENYLSLFYRHNFCPAGPNYTHFSDPAYDRLYEQSQQEIDDTLRFSLYQEMDNLMMQESPVVILYYDQVLRFVRKNVSGLGSNPINMLDLRKVKIENI
ncbi:MAG: ABC transporter substrate-binding protein [Bacteroidota bacterium]|nr:ABC transporter substrate-binding protein [Bacteroidota bacterium]